MILRPSLLYLLYFLLSISLSSSSSSSDLVIQGRCRQRCAIELTKTKKRVRNDGSIASEPDTKSHEFTYCRLGCRREADFNDEADRSSYQKGLKIREEIDDTATESIGRSAPIILNSVNFLCTQPKSANSTRLNVSIGLDVDKTNKNIINYHVQVYSRLIDGVKEHRIYSTNDFSTLVSIPIDITSKVEEVQVRAAAYDSMGLVGDTVASGWWSIDTLRDTTDIPLKMSLVQQMWLEERAAVLLSIDWPSLRVPSCDLTLKISHPDTGRTHEKIAVHMDETRAVVVGRLLYEETYAMQLEETAEMSSSKEEDTVSTMVSALVITVDPCLSMVIDPIMCPPPPVSALSYKWNTTDDRRTEGRSSIIVSWRFDPPWDSGVRKSWSHHFIVNVRLEHKSKRGDQSIKEARDVERKEKTIDNGERMMTGCEGIVRRDTCTADVRSAGFVVPLQCAFSVEVIVSDARNRRSRGVIIDSRQAEMESLQQVESGGIEITLLWAIFFIMCVTGVAVSLMVLRHQQRSTMKKKELKEREQHREILDSLYGRDTLGRYAPAPSAIHTFLTAPSPPLTEVPRGVYRVGRGWSGGDNSNLFVSKDASYASRLVSDDGYAICELHDETIDCQHNLSMFPLPHTDRSLYGVPVYSPVDYEMIELVGRGRFGEVYAAKFYQSGTITAVKQFDDSSDFQSELAISRCLCRSRSPFFPSLIGVVCPSDTLDHSLSALIYEYCPGGDLRSFLLTIRDSLPQRPHLTRSLRNVVPHIFCFLRATAVSLAELHSQSIVHRDISARNVLLTARWKDPFDLNDGCEAKLGDLGLCCRIDGEENNRRLSLPWQSPQVRKGGRYTIEDDIWSFGCLLLEVATLGGEPFLGGELPTIENGREIAAHIDTIGVGNNKIDSCLANRLRPLIMECLSIDRLNRPPINIIIDRLISLNTTGGTLQMSHLPYYSKDSQFV